MPASERDELNAEIAAALDQLKPGSLDEANAILAQIMDRRNHAPRADFCGLSPGDMVKILHYPFESANAIEFPSTLAVEPSGARISVFFEKLAASIGEKGLKATETGNLPRNTVRAIADEVLTSEERERAFHDYAIRTETDFRELHCCRVVAGLAGLVRKVHGRFTLTKSCQKLLASDGMRTIYPRLLKAYATKFNWGYQDMYPQASEIQFGFAFTLYLLHRFGGEWQHHLFYEDAFLAAFPFDAEGMPEPFFSVALDSYRRCYTGRSLERFCLYFGLVEIDFKQDRFIRVAQRVRKTRLLDEVVRFTVPTAPNRP